MSYCICIKNFGDFIRGYKYKYELQEVLEKSDDIFAVFLDDEREFYFVRDRFYSNFEDIDKYRDTLIQDILK